jgi:hypothetical protein
MPHKHPEKCRETGEPGPWASRKRIARKSNVEAVLRDLAERRVDADIEARDVAAPPIIRFLSRPPQSLNAHHLRACPLLQIASLVAHRSAFSRARGVVGPRLIGG